MLQYVAFFIDSVLTEAMVNETYNVYMQQWDRQRARQSVIIVVLKLVVLSF